MGTPRNSAAWKIIWRDTTHDTVSAFFSLENEPEHTGDIYKRIHGLIRNTCYGMMTISKCFLSILRLFQRKGGKPLPDDVVLDILSRLSAKDILNCRMVCRRWVSLTSTPCFLEHLTGSPPMILLHHYVPEGDLRLYHIDLTPKEPCIKRFDTKKLQLDRPPLFGGTCDGLVLLWYREKSSLRLYICNPFSGRKIMEVAAEGFFFCGFSFHPTKREYFFLTVSIGHGHMPEWSFQYKIFNLRGESTVVGWYATYPTNDVPININGSIYNLLQFPVPPRGCIMIFNIESEKIEFKPHPHNGHCNHGQGMRNNYNADMRLLEVEGSLGFVHLCSSGSNLHLWILADTTATWHWIPRYKLNLNLYHSTGAICVLSGIQKGEMLIYYEYRRLFAINLETRRVRKIDFSISYPKQDKFLTATTYASSFVGLNRLASFI